MLIDRWRSALVFVAAAIVAACTGSSPLMASAPSSASLPAGAPGVATVVFMRPKTFAYTRNFRIIDHAGRFVGEALSNAYFVVRPPPGEYVFILGDDEIDVLYANLAPGLVYYVTVVPVPGSFTARAQLRPIRPNDPERRRLSRYLEDRQFVPLYGRGQTEVDRDPGLRSRIERAKKMWAEMPAPERPAHTLGPTDGVPPPPVAAARP